ncbi:MAG: DNA mismatch repair endonuclease MutL [Bacteroidota bacterium]
MSHEIITSCARMGSHSGIINLLPDRLANQIAAGEVIQRPASAIKELLENALDAKATQIKVIIGDSGKTLIQVVDNGIGMSETDARLCFERHATSKIIETDDLFQIRSFGFRGEALASIAAVAQVELKTKLADADLGTHIIIEGSKVKKQEPTTHATGTSLSVKNLFFNVPARRKFLKSDPVELKHLLEEFARVAIPHPVVVFTLHHNGNELYHFPISNLRQRLLNYFGKSINEKIVPVQEETDFIKVTGFVGKPELIKKTRGDQYIFVNRRFIKSAYLNHAIKMSYENLVPEGQHPFYVLLLEVDPAMIDINIHPTKQEIKFENERLIYNYIKVAVKHALGKYSITPSLDFDAENTQAMGNAGASGRAPTSISSDTVQTAARPFQKQPSEKAKWLEFYEEMVEVTQRELSEAKAVTLSSDWSEGTDEGEPIAQSAFQLHESYIISPIKSGMIVIDQHRAHERILYEQHLKSISDKKMAAQASLFPETIQVEAKYVGLLMDVIEELAYIGFQIEKFGQNTFVVNGVPSDGLRQSTEAFIDQFLETYAANMEIQISIQENVARSMAANSAITKGVRLTSIEMQELIDQLFACEMPYTSPGGKKCFITFGLDEVENRFNS